MPNPRDNLATVDPCFSGRGAQGLNRVDVAPAHAVNTLKQDVTAGLFSKPRKLSPKYFYDEHGSKLFDRICETHEYYLTRTEDELLRENADEIIELARPDHIIEFGSGTSRKTRALFDACERRGAPCTYWAMDICAEMIEAGARGLQREYLWLEVNALVGDYSAGLENIKLPEGRWLALFLGSTVGNLNKSEAVDLLREIRSLLGPDSALLLGADLVKHRDLLDAAYDDAQGLTASFNLNVLNVLNRELDADFALENFSHYAFFNERKHRVEMHLVSRKRQRIRFGSMGRSLRLERGETIRTEISRKFTRDGIEQLMDSSECAPLRHFVSENEYFSLMLAHTGTGGVRAAAPGA